MSAAPASARLERALLALLLVNCLLVAVAGWRAGQLRRAWGEWELRRALRATLDGELLLRPVGPPAAPAADACEEAG
ncbi:MAG: hypothetical protein JNM72_11915 [Deltaproteobacteria bacterium]|nr:hypothetical protein [Deltaproteobacteria bacterium]